MIFTNSPARPASPPTLVASRELGCCVASNHSADTTHHLVANLFSGRPEFRPAWPESGFGLAWFVLAWPGLNFFLRGRPELRPVWPESGFGLA